MPVNASLLGGPAMGPPLNTTLMGPSTPVASPRTVMTMASGLNSSMLAQGPVAHSPMSPSSMERASQLVDRSMLTDANYNDLAGLLEVPKHSAPSSSGLQDMDYPSLADPKFQLQSLSQLGHMKRVRLPEELVEQFGNMQRNCMMGLFLEISRAWLAIDSDIFVWNYEDRSDLAYFDGLNETIISAGLVKPKPQIFQQHIAYLLCLTTPVDIVLLGVSFSKPYDGVRVDFSEMHLLPEPLFSIPTDNVNMRCIQGADDGRIFLGGEDGNLYELYYQAEDGWFSRKCRKINLSTSKLSYIFPSSFNAYFADDAGPLAQISIDDSRHILYTRSEKGTIQVFDLGEDGKGVSRVASISQQTIIHQASAIARTIDRSTFKSIVHIAAIPRSESVSVHLVAVTSTGARLYFTVNAFGQSRSRPNMLALIHVRMPPGFSASAGPQKPSNVHHAHYKRGTLLLAAAQTEDCDLMWTISGDLLPFQPKLMETYETKGLGGRTWALGEVPTGDVDSDPSAYQGPIQRADPPLVVTQHMQPPRRFVLLNSEGSIILTKLSPADQLKELLLLHQGPDSTEVKAFFKLLTPEQACATCLILACSYLNQAEPMVAEWARQAFFMYGGDPHFPMFQQHGQLGMLGSHMPMSPGPGASGYDPMTMTPAPGFNPSLMSTPFPGMDHSMAMPQATTLGPSLGTGMGQTEVQYSGKHQGLCLYLARILRPLWDQRLVSDIPCQSAKGQMQYLASSFRSEELGWFAEQVRALKHFIDRESQFTSPVLTDSSAMSAHGIDNPMLTPRPETLFDKHDNQSSEAQSQEKSSLQSLHALVHRICEVLGLWKILCDHQFHIIAGALTKDQQNLLKTLTFKNFVTSGKDVASALIQCLISRYLNDNAATDAISSRLREICPSLYSSEDAICAKGNEMLTVAKATQNKAERDTELREALQLYKQITGQLDLPAVVMQFASVRFYTGIVDLSMTAAGKRDPQGLGLHFYHNGQPPEDMQGLNAYMARNDSYRCITETLDHLLSTSMSHPAAPSVPTSPGPPPPVDPNRLTNAEAQKYTDDVFSMCLKSDDELFHVHLYDWLISHKLTEKLLEIHSPYLEPYLKRNAQLKPELPETLDLLWRYYEKTCNYTAAAKILAKLADRHSTDVTLAQRLEYLSRATMSAKSATSTGASSQQGEFLHELEEKMEVARLQLQIFEALSRKDHSDPAIQEALSRLNAELMDITTLYGEFADVFALAECKLAIIQCAGHYDPTLVEALWRNIIDNELRATNNAPVGTRMEILRSKLVSLGQMYCSTERYFPVAYLVLYLEVNSCNLGFDNKFVFETLQEIGVKLPKLLEIYDRLFKSKDPRWQSFGQPFHILRVICEMLTGLVNNPTLVPSYERRPFVNTCLDAVTSYLVELQASSSTNPSLQVLLRDLKNLQKRLERT